jgi:hypothetical protein
MQHAAESISYDSAVPLWTADEVQDSILSRTSGAAELIDGNRAGVTFVTNHQLLIHQVLRDTVPAVVPPEPGYIEPIPPAFVRS